MKRRKYLAVLSVFSALILALVAVIPASADRPVHEKNAWVDYEWIWPAEQEDNPCGVDLNVRDSGKMEYFVWLDRNGEPYADTQLINNDMTISVTPDREVTLHFNLKWSGSWIT